MMNEGLRHAHALGHGLRAIVQVIKAEAIAQAFHARHTRWSSTRGVRLLYQVEARDSVDANSRDRASCRLAVGVHRHVEGTLMYSRLIRAYISCSWVQERIVEWWP